jgi:hypothetical protein
MTCNNQRKGGEEGRHRDRHEAGHARRRCESHIIDSLQDAEQSALEAVRKFVDAVDGAFPDVVEAAPRRKILDAAFKMTEQLVGTSNQLAHRIVTVTENALDEFEKKTQTAKKWPRAGTHRAEGDR